MGKWATNEYMIKNWPLIFSEQEPIAKMFESLKLAMMALLLCCSHLAKFTQLYFLWAVSCLSLDIGTTAVIMSHDLTVVSIKFSSNYRLNLETQGDQKILPILINTNSMAGMILSSYGGLVGVQPSSAYHPLLNAGFCVNHHTLHGSLTSCKLRMGIIRNMYLTLSEIIHHLQLPAKEKCSTLCYQNYVSYRSRSITSRNLEKEVTTHKQNP
jgi:hypothetical protein